MPYTFGDPLEPKAAVEAAPSPAARLSPVAPPSGAVGTLPTPTASTLPRLGPTATVEVIEGA